MDFTKNVNSRGNKSNSDLTYVWCLFWNVPALESPCGVTATTTSVICKYKSKIKLLNNYSLYRVYFASTTIILLISSWLESIAQRYPLFEIVYLPCSWFTDVMKSIADIFKKYNLLNCELNIKNFVSKISAWHNILTAVGNFAHTEMCLASNVTGDS